MIEEYIKRQTEYFRVWVKTRYLSLAVFNVLLILLTLLRSAGYFDPIFTISINLIVVLAMILSVVLLGVTSRFLFILTIVFWLLAFFFRAILQIDVWAERAAIYTFEALVFGVLMLIIEGFSQKRKDI